MDATIKLRAVLVQDAIDVQALVQHPMDSGFAKTPDEEEIPAHYIETVTFEHNGKIVFVADWGPMISRNPYVRFSFSGGKRGGEMKVRWIDNLGLSDSAVSAIE